MITNTFAVPKKGQEMCDHEGYRTVQCLAYRAFLSRDETAFRKGSVLASAGLLLAPGAGNHLASVYRDKIH